MTETRAECPSEAVFGGDDEDRYPCTYERGHEPPHSWEHPNLYPPSAADLARGMWAQGGSCATCGLPVPGGGHRDGCTGLVPGSEYRIDSRDNGEQSS